MPISGSPANDCEGEKNSVKRDRVTIDLVLLMNCFSLIYFLF
ncbi:hypothetical protein VIBNISFn118_1020006 [Vibrio nigripulchritudo SFn118]|nr:hypothetical protein VIBNISFn118_1020006 [Vibrio nigripulchritudo SFn118]